MWKTVIFSHTENRINNKISPHTHWTVFSASSLLRLNKIDHRSSQGVIHAKQHQVIRLKAFCLNKTLLEEEPGSVLLECTSEIAKKKCLLGNTLSTSYLYEIYCSLMWFPTQLLILTWSHHRFGCMPMRR